LTFSFYGFCNICDFIRIFSQLFASVGELHNHIEAIEIQFIFFSGCIGLGLFFSLVASLDFRVFVYLYAYP